MVQTVVDQARDSVDGDEVVRVAQRLVRIPSENPSGDTREVCAAIVDELAPAGFKTEIFEAGDGHDSVIATYDFPTPGPTLILNGHIDVVPVGDTAGQWQHDPVGGEIDGGRLYGRGAMDMKGQVAGLLVAARSVAQCGAALGGRIVFTAVADEEQGGKRGAGALIEAGKIDGDAVLVVEASSGGVTLAHRGMSFFELTTHGRSAHASVPENGVNAVLIMAEALLSLRSVQMRHTPHPLLGSPSVAIGTIIEGGRKANVIPDTCKASLDIRHVPGMNRDEVLEDLREHFRAADLPVDIESILWAESGETSPDEEIVRVTMEAHEREFGEVPVLRGERAATDGWWFTNRAELPTIMALGPGTVKEVHIVDESIDVGELQRYSRVYADVIARFLTTVSV
ncbi:MAG: succinyl-diaminopimelate desuccinylase [Baekduia sp.]|jgi:succinyl-diaminopimelate desuccinylase|nr:succinyl-diaminopimelate desuccinylase [Baekduia sp.]